MGVKVLIWEYANYIKGGWRSMNNLRPAALLPNRTIGAQLFYRT